MTDYLNPDKLYPDDVSRRIDNPPGFDSIRPGMVNQCILCGAEMPEGDHVCTECVRAADERKDNSRKVKSMIIDGIEVTVQGDEALPGEVEGYVRRGIKENGTRLTGMAVTLDGADVDIHYILKRPFERIRRITGYLVGTTDRWNNAKRMEERDRVKHSTTINAALYEELKARATGRVDVAPGPDSIRPSATGVADKREGVAHD